MTELRDKVARAILDYEGEEFGHECALELADRVLEIPEIRNALAFYATRDPGLEREWHG